MANFFAAIELRRFDSVATDNPIYVSNFGGSRVVGSTLQNFRKVASFGRIAEQFGDLDSAIESPTRLGIEMANGDGFYNSLLPNGSNPQFWVGSKLTLYSGGADGDNVSTMTNHGEYYIIDGSLQYSPSFISFECQDARSLHDVSIGTDKFVQADNWDPVDADDSVAGNVIPIILGDWTAGSLPGYRIDGPDDGSADTLWKVCDHEIGSVVVTVGTGTVTPSATDYAVGEFTLSSAQWNGSDEVSVACVGHQTTITDDNAITMFKGLINLFANSALAAVTFYTGGGVGDVDDAYTQFGGASPVSKFRRYITEETTLLQEIATLAKEAVMLPWIEEGDYRVIFDGSLFLSGTTPQTPIDVSDRKIYGQEGNADVVLSARNPNGEYANVGIIGYAVDSTGTATLVYDTREFMAEGLVQESRDRYGQDVYWTDTFVYLYDGRSTIERRMFRRSSQEVLETLTASAVDLDDDIWDIGLARDIKVNHWILEDLVLRTMSVTRNLDTLRLDIVARNMNSLPTLYRWTDDNGEINGFLQVGNTWRSDTDTTGGVWG